MGVMSEPTVDLASGSLAPQAADLPPPVRALLAQLPESDRQAAAMVQTHISWVVLAGPFAYKLKKPVALGFLDFSTLEKRHDVCRREVELNRRLCPWVYLGVLPIYAEKDSASGGRTVVDYAVQMRRLPDDRMLDVLLERDQVTAAEIEAIADLLAGFHATAATGPGIDEHGATAAVRANVAENTRQTRPFIGRTLDARAWELVSGACARFLERRTTLFERRMAEGRIRDGHGDLHASNVCLTEPIAIFDCIEFNDRFRYGDVAAEVAFLTMDLELNGRPDLASAFVDRYVSASGDDGLRDVLDFYLCYRAYVRGKVESLSLDEPGFSAEAYESATLRARRYFALAERYAERL
jgi:aminoglycoside phosphotransferase family enzyme